MKASVSVSPLVNQEGAWIDQSVPNVRANEQAIVRSELAKFTDIVRFGSQYWGGLLALAVVVLCMVLMIVLAVNDALYEAVRGFVAHTDQALSDGVWASFVKRLGALLGLVGLILLGYQALLRWSSMGSERIHAWGLAVLVLVLSTVNVKLGVEFIEWSGNFWESVKNKETQAYYSGLVLFAKLAFSSIVVGIYRQYFSQLLQIRWRTWLTQRYSQVYLSKNRFYQLEQVQGQDNPDQRIADDLNRFTDMAVALFFGFYLAALSVYEYARAMIKMSVHYEGVWFGHAVYIPNYMFWSVVVYTIFGSLAIHGVGRRLTKINMLRERYNADFRYHLIRAREYAEGIAFLQGDAHHLRGARHLFTIIRANWYHYMTKIKSLTFAQSIYAQAGIIFPVMVAVPLYFAGKSNFGAIMKAIRAFGELREGLSWFIDNYSTWAELRASSSRIFNLDRDLSRVDDMYAQSELYVQVNHVGGIALTHTQLNRPQKSADGALSMQAQVSGLDWQISMGERWLITGASGSGKSTILRAIAGMWPFGQGRIDVPNKGKMMFLPQRPYMPVATLREALSYPDVPERFNDEAYRTVLSMSRMEHLSERLDEHNHWAWLLSGGEQQRLSFARLFLHKPQYVLLDEATSALDEVNELLMYQTMLEHTPEVTLISVSHHPQLASFHPNHLHLVAEGQGFRPIITHAPAATA